MYDVPNYLVLNSTVTDCLLDMFEVVLFPLFSCKKDWKIALKIVW